MTKKRQNKIGEGTFFQKLLKIFSIMLRKSGVGTFKLKRKQIISFNSKKLR